MLSEIDITRLSNDGLWELARFFGIDIFKWDEWEFPREKVIQEIKKFSGEDIKRAFNNFNLYCYET